MFYTLGTCGLVMILVLKFFDQLLKPSKLKPFTLQLVNALRCTGRLVLQSLRSGVPEEKKVVSDCPHAFLLPVTPPWPCRQVKVTTKKKLTGNNHHEKCARLYLISEKSQC